MMTQILSHSWLNWQIQMKGLQTRSALIFWRRKSSGNVFFCNSHWQPLNHQSSLSNQVMINLSLKKSSSSNAWKKEWRDIRCSTGMIGRWRLLSFTEHIIWRDFCQNSWDTDIASGVSPVSGMPPCLTRISTTPICKKCPKSREGPWETQLKHLYLKTKELKLLTYSHGQPTPLVPIDWASKYRFNDEIKSRNEDEFVFFHTTFIFPLFPWL